MGEEDGQDIGNGHDDMESEEEEVAKPRELPADLPRTLDDRQNFPSYSQETEYYDAWQGAASAQ